MAAFHIASIQPGPTSDQGTSWMGASSLYAAIVAARGVCVEVAGADGAGSPGCAAGSVDEHPTTTAAVAATTEARRKI
ncbi:hypothetical protein MGAD_51320 [Mycolicibacterium gadium]|uniref:Uncharacterized protein n=1 Tax=Mycolicibacterium gadium TaxID=1794 RepID=A0A7I7WVN7_MYCGU|nr:hypothetical protein MGAD_51320 [Mycolicibacterium gadium]